MNYYCPVVVFGFYAIQTVSSLQMIHGAGLPVTSQFPGNRFPGLMAKDNMDSSRIMESGSPMRVFGTTMTNLGDIPGNVMRRSIPQNMGEMPNMVRRIIASNGLGKDDDMPGIVRRTTAIIEPDNLMGPRIIKQEVSSGPVNMQRNNLGSLGRSEGFYPLGIRRIVHVGDNDDDDGISNVLSSILANSMKQPELKPDKKGFMPLGVGGGTMTYMNGNTQRLNGDVTLRANNIYVGGRAIDFPPGATIQTNDANGNKVTVKRGQNGGFNVSRLSKVSRSFTFEGKDDVVNSFNNVGSKSKGVSIQGVSGGFVDVSDSKEPVSVQGVSGGVVKTSRKIQDPLDGVVTTTSSQSKKPIEGTARTISNNPSYLPSSTITEEERQRRNRALLTPDANGDINLSTGYSGYEPDDQGSESRRAHRRRMRRQRSLESKDPNHITLTVNDKISIDPNLVTVYVNDQVYDLPRGMTLVKPDGKGCFYRVQRRVENGLLNTDKKCN